jgi:hypothetical protein
MTGVKAETCGRAEGRAYGRGLMAEVVPLTREERIEETSTVGGIKMGVSAFLEEFSEKMNVRPELKEAVLSQAREILAFARPLRAHRQLLEIEGQEEFLGTGAATSSLG